MKAAMTATDLVALADAARATTPEPWAFGNVNITENTLAVQYTGIPVAAARREALKDDSRTDSRTRGKMHQRAGGEED